MDKLRKVLSGHDDLEQGGGSGGSGGSGSDNGFQEILDSSSLSWGTRVKGFIICFAVGFIFSIIGSIFLFFTKTTTFAVFYTLGSLTSLGSTLFLMGPIKQCQKMFASTRVIATVIMFLSIGMTLFFAFHKGGRPAACLIFVVIQFLAMTWYSISYIPFARDGVKKIVSGIFS